MKKYNFQIDASLLITLLFFLFACNENGQKNNVTSKDDVKTTTTDTAKSIVETTTQKPPIINIVDTIAAKSIIVCIKDSATTFERVSIKLAEVYGVKLAEILKKNGLKSTGAPMAWYKSEKAPYFFEAGMPVNKIPTKLLNKAFIKELKTDSVMVAHFYGPYNLLSLGYDAIKERLVDENKIAIGAPYEIYISDPIDSTGNIIDPYKVRTDIVFPRKLK